MAARSAAGGRAAAEGPSPSRPQKPSGLFPASSRLRAHDESNQLSRSSSSSAKGKEAVVGIAPGAVGACVDVLGQDTCRLDLKPLEGAQIDVRHPSRRREDNAIARSCWHGGYKRINDLVPDLEAARADARA